MKGHFRSPEYKICLNCHEPFTIENLNLQDHRRFCSVSCMHLYRMYEIQIRKVKFNMDMMNWNKRNSHKRKIDEIEL
jgi:hypothetical protein